MSEFNYTAASVAVVNHERKSARLEGTYDGLVAFLNLTPDTDSAEMTEAARMIVINGAHNDGTATGKALTVDMLTGRDPGKCSHRDYWKAARTVRIGLVNAVKRANQTEEDSEEEKAEEPKNLLTRAGLSATLEEVTAAWHAAQK